MSLKTMDFKEQLFINALSLSVLLIFALIIRFTGSISQGDLVWLIPLALILSFTTRTFGSIWYRKRQASKEIR